LQDPQAALGYATVLSNAFSACRESSLVCCATTGTSERMTLEKSLSLGIGSGLPRANIVKRYKNNQQKNAQAADASKKS